MKKRQICIAYIFLLFFPFTSISQEISESVIREFVESNMMEQLRRYPQEKIYLHVDRDYYIPGDRIWFKAYLTHASTHQRFDGSRYVYVDLLSPTNTLVSRVLIRPDDNGLHHGNIHLTEFVPEGYYTLRAYTKYMSNNEDDVYKKLIRIGNPVASLNTGTRMVRQTREDFDVSFFPEGGHLLEGVFCRVAFKALSSGGYSENVTGEIVDQDGNEIVSFKALHAGMGGFGFIPERGKVYMAVCYNAKGESKRFQLPEAQHSAYTLTTSYWRDKRLTVGRLKSSDLDTFDQMYVLAHSRGMLLYFGEWNEDREYFSFTESQLPSGVIQILLFDKDMNPVSERLVFSKSREEAVLELSTDRDGYKMREHVLADVSLLDGEGQPLKGDLSVSVTDDGDLPVNNSSTIFSTLLLTSELKGYIEAPGYYFEEENDTALYALDYLMMTQGWRRYDIPEVMKGNFSYAEQPFEKNMEISGRVERLLTSGSVRKGEVTLLVVNTAEFMRSPTDEDGRFSVSEIEYPDSTQFFIRSTNRSGGESVELQMNESVSRSLARIPGLESGSITVEPEKEEEEAGRFLAKAEERYKYDEDMRLIYLSEVEVVAKRLEREPEAFSVFSGGASNSITLGRIQEMNAVSVEEVFRTIPGLTVYSQFDGARYTMKAMFEGSYRFDVFGDPKAIPPVIIIDDVIIHDEEDPFSLISVQDIERVDVFRPEDSSIFGARGAGGAISITTRRALPEPDRRMRFNQQIFMPLGYQRPVEFYSPRYETDAQKFNIMPDLRTTIYWKPDVMVTEEGGVSLDFYTADFMTTYSIVVEGLSEDGRVVRGVKQIKVE